MPTRDRIRGCLLGVAIGDALGAPVETWSIQRIAEKHGRITEYFAPKGHKYLKPGRPPGLTTDDWQLTAATAEAILEADGFTMQSQVDWHVKAMHDTTDGWGKTTKENIKRFTLKKNDGISVHDPAPSEDRRGTGNGVCMKIAPLALWSAATTADYHEFLVPYSRMTHNTRLAVASGAAMTWAYYSVLATKPGEFDAREFKDEVIGATLWAERQYDIPELGAGIYESSDPDALPDYHQLSNTLGYLDVASQYDPLRIVEAFKGGCYVYESLPFSLMFFARNPETIETLYDVASAGGDTDSNASMVGGLLGAYHGASIFPDRLIDGLANKNEVLPLIERFAERYGSD